ncbi:hypothetical protein T07_2151 [Trichinella nelsoni]|uniref:Secreted protein n=1 Tax=Trichinella nelsoni TaxID=6336 RepID=A0A0V0RGZ0_9BILA|nr:hypothetical protein T07_2151 [Trichinella nelsoni]
MNEVQQFLLLLLLNIAFVQRRNRNVALVRTATNPTINNETMRNDTVSFCVGALMTVTLSTSRIRIFCLRKDHLAVLVNSSASDVDP